MIPSEIDNINSLQKFKIEIRKWAPENLLSLSVLHIQNLGFIYLV